jgi:hypothetical protein
MSNRSRKNAAIIAALVLGFGSALQARAETIGGFLGAAAGSTDVYGMTCPEGTQSVRARVNEADVAGIQFSVQVIDPGGRARSASAVNGGQSATVALGGGAGNYLVTVHKDAAGGEGYNVTLDCHGVNGVALGVGGTRVQNN